MEDPISAQVDRLGVPVHRTRVPGPLVPVVQYERVADRTARTLDGPSSGEVIYFVAARADTFTGAAALLDDVLAGLGERLTRTRGRRESTVDIAEKPAYEASVYVYVGAT